MQETWKRKVSKLVHLTINNETISTTENHPFYVDKAGFVNAIDLNAGDFVVSAHSSGYRVQDKYVEDVLEQVTVYNLEVDEFHTYFVGRSGIWVHNKCDYIVNDDGTVEITDWGDYPEGQPKPDGTVKLIDGDDYIAARQQANAANSTLHRNDPSLKGSKRQKTTPIPKSEL